MKHYSTCRKCYEANETNDNSVVLAVGELTSDLFAICICPEGHKTLTSLMAHLPDILFTSAVNAFRKECYSESILSFSAAFERISELFFKAFCLKSGSSIEVLEQMWKELKNQSERQYGAFCIAYCITTGAAWRADDKQVEFRNKVVHKGHIATALEAEGYATYVTEKMDGLIALLNSKFEKETNEIYFYFKEQASPKLKEIMKKTPDLKFSGDSTISLLRWDHAERKTVSFRDVLNTAESLGPKFGLY